MSFASRPVRYRHDDALTRVSWDEFERRVADHYRRQGYVVEHTGTLSREHRKSGIDLTLRSGLESILVKCMHWPAQQVPHDHVHQLIAAIPSEGATGAIVVTSGEFTQAAIETGAKFRHIKLIDGMAVRAMFGQVVEPETNWATARQDADDDREKSGGRNTTPRAPIIAAVSAVVVMGVLLLALYSFYIREIHQAQMEAMRNGGPPASSSVHMKAGPFAQPDDVGEPVAEWHTGH